MGEVVDIESKPRKRQTRRKKPSKTALVLGGGGFTGGVYEIGALRALDLLAVNSTVNNFDVYVGTSAGSFVASMLANGVTPEEMMQVINSDDSMGLEDLDLDKVLKPNYLGFLSKGVALPLRTMELLRSLVRIGEFSAMDIGVGLAEALPTGLYSGSGLSDYVEDALGTATASTTSASSTPSSTSPRPTSTPASGSSSARRAGQTCRSPKLSSARPACRSSTSRST